MLSFSLVAEALTGLIYHRPSGENSKIPSMAQADKYRSTRTFGCPPALDRNGHARICLKVTQDQVEASELIYDKHYTIEVIHTSFMLNWATKNQLDI